MRANFGHFSKPLVTDLDESYKSAAKYLCIIEGPIRISISISISACFTKIPGDCMCSQTNPWTHVSFQ